MWNKRLFDNIEPFFKWNAMKMGILKVDLVRGSLSQMPWLYLDSPNSITHPYTYYSLEVESCCKLEKQFIDEASEFCFRVRKDRIKTLDSYCCYTFNSFKEVPDDWRITRNIVFNFGDVIVWNLRQFTKSIERFIVPRLLDEEMFEESVRSKTFTINCERITWNHR